jgi:hypothetical protein
VNDKDGQQVAGEFQQMAEKCGRPFLPICLLCDIDENQQRISNSERKNGGTTKLVCSKTLKSIRLQNDLYYFENVEVYTLDVTWITPDEAARRISEHMSAHGGVTLSRSQ